MKIMITGATGLLGRALVRILGKKHEILGIGFSRAKPPLYKLNLENATEVEAFIRQHRPGLVIHAAAERQPDRCENDHQHTMRMNCEVVAQLANLCEQYGSEMMFFSTDYVFDGKQPPYNENASVHPLNFYGHSKAAAEALLLKQHPTFSVLRIPVLYGPVEYLAESAVTVLAEQLKNAPQAPLDNWAIRYPTHVDDIALLVCDMLSMLTRDERCGVFHLADSQAMTKFGMACLLAPTLGLDIESLSPLNEASGSANRPQNCALKDSRLKKRGIERGRDFSAAILEAVRPYL